MFCNNGVYVCMRWRCSRWWDCQTGFCGEDYCRFAWSAQAKLNQCCCFCRGRHLADYTAEPPPTQHTHTSKPSREGHKPRVTWMDQKETTSALWKPCGTTCSGLGHKGEKGWTNEMFPELDGWGQLCHTGIRAAKRKRKGAQMWGGLELRRLNWFTT